MKLLQIFAAFIGRRISPHPLLILRRLNSLLLVVAIDQWPFLGWSARFGALVLQLQLRRRPCGCRSQLLLGDG